MEFTEKKIDKYFSDVPNRYNETRVRFYLNLTLAHANWGETDEASIYNNEALQSKDTCSRILQEEISFHSAALDWLCYEKPPPVVCEYSLFVLNFLKYLIFTLIIYILYYLIKFHLTIAMWIFLFIK